MAQNGPFRTLQVTYGTSCLTYASFLLATLGGSGVLHAASIGRIRTVGFPFVFLVSRRIRGFGARFCH